MSRKQQLEANRRQRARWAAEGYCPRCGKEKPDEGYKYGAACLWYMKQRYKPKEDK